MKLIKEAKRLQQLAGINEITVNKPQLQPLKIESIYDLSTGEGGIYEYITLNISINNYPEIYIAEWGDTSPERKNNLTFYVRYYDKDKFLEQCKNSRVSYQLLTIEDEDREEEYQIWWYVVPLKYLDTSKIANIEHEDDHEVLKFLNSLNKTT